MNRLVVLLLVACAHPPSTRAPPAPANASLTFERAGATVTTLDLAAMQRAAPPETWRAFDPYYRREKGWWTVDLATVLRAAFGPDIATADGELQLTAVDGYAVLLPLSQAFEGGAALAFADADGPWEAIGPQRASPGPFYLVWKGPEQTDSVTHPRPWGLARIALVKFEEAYSWTVPPRRDARIDEGYQVFRQQCVRCHAVNRQGGHVGPELNVPQNVTEYRPRAQLRAYVRNPLQFRYGNMPPFPHLSEEQLDAVLDYLAAMKDRKHDDGQSGGH